MIARIRFKILLDSLGIFACIFFSIYLFFSDLVACDRQSSTNVATPLAASSPLPSGFKRKDKWPLNEKEHGLSRSSLEEEAVSFVAKDLSRVDFNRMVGELNLPFFWSEDRHFDQILDPSELILIWGVDASDESMVDSLKPGSLSPYVTMDGKWTRRFQMVYRSMLGQRVAEAQKTGREKLVLDELAQGRPTLIYTDLSSFSEKEKNFARLIFEAASLIERLYAKQMGVDSLQLESDPASRFLFFRNQSPKCMAPKTEKQKNCGALSLMPEGILSGLYPKEIWSEPNFCEMLSRSSDQNVMNPFTVVQGSLAHPKSVPYTQMYSLEMNHIANLLEKAAGELKAQNDDPLTLYLMASASSFRSNDWTTADEAWIKAGLGHSPFYLRIAPDEVYSEPCGTKALFHVSFGLVNRSSEMWKSKLDPLKGEMEVAMSKLAGLPYRPRDVHFDLPDFVDIILNAGDSRSAFGATIGQSLPNFGPVANEGRGRTVAMLNFYNDVDSIEASQKVAFSLFCPSVMRDYVSDPGPQLMSTVLHEAAHNLGPAHQYRVSGKTDREIFGGPLSNTLEELKAQSASMYYADWLASKDVISKNDATKAHVRDLLWAFGHVSRGMYDDNHHPKNYSQLSAIQLGMLMDGKVVEWENTHLAANGIDRGCFSVNFVKFPFEVKKMMTKIANMKSRGDKKEAETLIQKYVDGDQKKFIGAIADRYLRVPKASFYYGIRLDHSDFGYASR